MADDDGSYQRRLDALAESEPQNTQNIQQRAVYEHPAPVRMTWQTLMRSLPMSPQLGPNYNTYQQRESNLNHLHFDPTANYYAPHARREPQVAERQSPLHGFQGQRFQSRDSRIQQYVRPSDVSLSPALHQSNTFRWASNNPSTDHLPSRSSAPIDMFASRPTLATHKPPQDMNQVQERMALAEYLQRFHGRNDQPVVPQTTQPATFYQKSNVQARENWPERHSGGQDSGRHSSQTHSMASYIPTTSQYTNPYTSVSRSALGPRTDTPSTSGEKTCRPAVGPANSTSQSPRPTGATPTVSGQRNCTSSASSMAIASAQRPSSSTSQASCTPHHPPLPQRHLPHSTLLAPQGPGPNRTASQNTTGITSPSLTTARSQIRASGRPSSIAMPSSSHPNIQQPGARGTHVSSPRQQALPQSTSASLLKNTVPTDIQSSRGKNSPDLHIRSGLPVPPATMNASSEDHGLPDRIRLQTSENGPPFKIRRVEDGTKRAATPANSSVSLVRVPSAPKHLLAQLDMARPVDAREAAVKVSYDPATIARDILISVNRHPTEKYLNHHLDVLRRFAAVDLSTDLDTFRWDLVDPYLPRDPELHCPAAPPTSDTRLPNQQPPASSVAPLPGKPPSFPSFTGPIPPPSFHTSPPTTAHPQFAQVHLSRPPPSAPTQERPEPNVSSPCAPTAPIAPPPISSKAEPAARTMPSTISKPPQLSPTPARPTSSQAPSIPPRNKSYPEPQVVVEPSPDVMPTQKRKPGRPRKGGKQVEVGIHNQPSVAFPVFRCAWSKCQSELHNMDALQRHVLKCHIPHELTCGWEGCDNQTPMAASKLWQHVQEKHLQSVAWALGDGPSVPPIADERDESSPHAMQPTRHERQATIIWPVNQTIIESYCRVYGLKGTKDKAEAMKAGGSHWKGEVGCEIDQSARRLSKPSMQAASINREVAYSIRDGSS